MSSGSDGVNDISRDGGSETGSDDFRSSWDSDGSKGISLDAAEGTNDLCGDAEDLGGSFSIPLENIRDGRGGGLRF